MPTAREIMTPNPTSAQEDQSVVDAARLMADIDAGALPIGGNDNRLKGTFTDRDIVVKVLAQGQYPTKVKVGELGQGKPVTIGADDDAAEILRTMAQHKVRRLPVIDGHGLAHWSPVDGGEAANFEDIR